MKQLRLTTTKPMGMLEIMNSIEDHSPLTKPNDVGELIIDKIKGRTAYIHGEAENIAGFDIPTFIDGNLAQLELPIEQQDILLLLPSGEYKCKAEYYDEIGASNCYLITLVTEPSVVVEKGIHIYSHFVGVDSESKDYFIVGNEVREIGNNISDFIEYGE